MIIGSRRGQGTIVGGTIIILIIVTAYGLYVSYSRSQQAYDQLQRDIRRKDFERKSEKLEYFYEVENDTDKVELHIKNIGSLSSHIIYISDIDANTSEIKKHSTDFYINPGGDRSIVLTLDNLGINITGTDIQLISERGNIYQHIYEPIKDKPITRRELNVFLGALTHTFGDYLTEYRSWSWAEAQTDDTYDEDSWKDTWFLPPSKDLVFRINMTYYGELEPMVLGQETVLSFYKSQSSHVEVVYIVNNNGVYNDETLVKYDAANPTEIWWGENVTLYFAAHPNDGDEPNGLKFSASGGHTNVYTGVIVLDDIVRGYAQSFPLIGIKVE